MSPTQPHFEDVILLDGSALRLRAPRTEDAAIVLEFLEGLSPHSRGLRFHGAIGDGRAIVTRFLDPDWRETGALVGTRADDDGVEHVVGFASYQRLRESSRAEVAFAVADSLQGHGVGTRLLERLVVHASGVGIERFVAEVLQQNARMIDVFESTGFELERELAGGVIEVEFPISQTTAARDQVELHDHVAVRASLAPFFLPGAVAVLGASPRAGSIGGELFRNVLRDRFVGTAYPVNRGGESVEGVTGYATVDAIPGPVDLAVICVPAPHVLESAEECLRHGIRALCVISAGFAEIGPEGAERQRELLDLVRSHGARLIGPNCLGIAVAERRLNATFARNPVPAGNIGFSSQSGALGLAVIEAATARDLGLSAFVSIGNKADVSSNDLLEWWEDDTATALILLYLESFGNPRTFARVARRISRRKPILAMKAGVTEAGARAASSHTAALAGSEAGVDALFRHTGVLRADTLEELLDLAALLSHQPPPRGRRVAIVTNAGGLGIICADACVRAGLELPTPSDDTVAALSAFLPGAASLRNPVDMLGSATAADYERAVPLLLADPRVDALIGLFVPPVSAGVLEVADAIERAAAGAPKPVLTSLLAASPVGPRATFVNFPYPESAARALARAAERSEWLRRPAGRVPTLDRIDSDAAAVVVAHALEREDDVWLDPAEARRLLEAYGLPVVRQREVASPDGAVAAAQELGFPVVVKSGAPGAHKTESGGVALDLRDEEAVRVAGSRIGGDLVVQPMRLGGVELLVGLVHGRGFDPLVVFGPGGTQAELIGGAASRIAPLTDVDAAELVSSGPAGRLVAGFRGRAAVDRASLLDLLHRLSRLAVDRPEISELDLNPVIADEHGCVVVDARVRLRALPEDDATKTW
jgi:acetyl coenzyme A synthetase (ADP forming)-like protein